MLKYQPSSAGGTRSPPAKSKMANRVWRGVYPQVFGHSRQQEENKTEKKEENNEVFSGH